MGRLGELTLREGRSDGIVGIPQPVSQVSPSLYPQWMPVALTSLPGPCWKCCSLCPSLLLVLLKNFWSFSRLRKDDISSSVITQLPPSCSIPQPWIRSLWLQSPGPYLPRLFMDHYLWKCREECSLLFLTGKIKWTNRQRVFSLLLTEKSLMPSKCIATPL